MDRIVKQKTIDSLADAALTIGMLIVGASLKFKVSPENMKIIISASLIKLIITPIITFLILKKLMIYVYL
jgi:predicted permease